MQHCYEDKNTEECKDDAEGDFGGDDVARRPFRHLEGVRRLRGENIHRHKRRDEREIVDCKELKRTPCARFTRYKRKDRHVDLPRAESIDESAASAPQQPFTCETATGEDETLRSSIDFDAASPAAISPNDTPSGGTVSRVADSAEMNGKQHKQLKTTLLLIFLAV